jgi:predicted signal transduction protein with EAL and GGDEF domain
LGGDEFAVLLPNHGCEAAVAKGRRLARTLERPFYVRQLALQIETAVGVAVFPDHGNHAGELLQRADVAMYVAKSSRSAVEVYDADRDVTSVRALTLNGELRRAIEEQGLSLHYQPKISAASGLVIGVEALVRWTHPEHGNIPPDEFIGPAEQSGLIAPLTRWVMETAVAQAALWSRTGFELDVSVNLSARNLLDEELPSRVQRLLGTTRLAPERLTLEITESAIMSDPARARQIVTEVDRQGVRISIDDFGTGYSSLGYLRNLPARELKIDRSFVSDMDRIKEDATIVRSTIELAHNLGLHVVAEGVERSEVWTSLVDMGCDFGQGYLFSKPLPANELTEWLKETREPALVLK